MFKLKLQGENAYLEVSIFGVENPNAKNYSDANWLQGDVDVKLPGFSVNYEANFTIQDFISFQGEVGNALNQILSQPEVTFQTCEEQLEFSLKFTRTGRVKVNGKCRVHEIPRGCLDFYFETDLISVEVFAKEIQGMLKNFEVEF